MWTVQSKGYISAITFFSTFYSLAFLQDIVFDFEMHRTGHLTFQYPAHHQVFHQRSLDIYDISFKFSNNPSCKYMDNKRNTSQNGGLIFPFLIVISSL